MFAIPMITIEMLNWFPQLDEQALAIRAAATARIIALLNTIEALRDEIAELIEDKHELATENARYKRALECIVSQEEDDLQDAIVYVYGVAQSALDDLPF